MTDRETIVRDLVRPGVELIETHISWVLLDEDEVWKIKKPVDFGFLDFSTLELREAACRAEVALNRRLAPDVYLGVVPLTRGADGTLRVGGEGDVVDFALHMRRLPDRDRADIRLAEGRLGPAEIRRIASCLADFHAGARCDETTAEFGSTEATGRNVQENFDQTKQSVTQYISEEEAAEVELGQLGFLKDRRARFQGRVADERIRDGHGDLRLEHVYIDDDGNVTIIDCIEFNDRFRYADVAADLAFLAMDLSEHEHVELSELLVAEYARASGDYDLYSVLDFYEGYRAYVRGKISAFVAADPSVSFGRRERAEASARHYFLLSLSAERRALLRPMVVAVGGIIAAGKSTVSDRLGMAMSAPIVDADRTRKQMLGVRETQPVHDASWKGAYDPAFTEEVYAEVFRRAAVVLESGRPVIVDASFRSRALRGRALDVARSHDVPFAMVECRVDPEVARERLRERARSASVSDGRLDVFDDFVASWEVVDELAPEEHVVLDTARPIESNLAELERVVSTWPAGLVR